MTGTKEPRLADWPDYSTLFSSAFPEWLKKSVLELVAAYPDQLKEVGFEFWFTNEYNDNNNVIPHANEYLLWEDPDNRPSEDDLDHIPGMRRMSRNGVELVDMLAVESDDEGGSLHEIVFSISRDGLYFRKTEHCEENGIFFSCKPGAAGWVCEAIFKTYLGELELNGLSETALISGDKDMIVADLDPSMAGLTAWPSPLRYERVEEEGIDLIFELNEFMEKMEG